VLKFQNTETVNAGVGQITTFNQLGFKGSSDKPDGWYLPNNSMFPAIILETKSTKIELKEKQINELLKNCTIAHKKYKSVIGVLYNGIYVRAFIDGKEIKVQEELQNKEYYLSFFSNNRIDKQEIYNLTKKINDCLHFNFGVKNLYHRMVFTACALVAKRYGASLIKGMNYPTFHTSIHSTLSKSFKDQINQNSKLNILLEVYSEIKMNSSENQEAIDNFINWICDISDCINSDYWNGEDVMAIFFNEFTRYKGKAEKGQVFTPDHITSFMYRLIEVNKDDRVLDAACGSGAFLVKSMCNMIKEAGGISTDKAQKIKENQLFGIEFDREIYALACANMLIHKDGKTNLEQLDSRTSEAGLWMKSLSFIKDKNGEDTLTKNHITKVLMNPPFENKYGCLIIVENVLANVKKDTMCAFILPDNKLEKNSGKAKRILLKHRLMKIIKLPENIFTGVTASIFIFKSGFPQLKHKIFACYLEDDGFETLKNQGRHDIKNRWTDIENDWIDIVYRQGNHDSIQWLDPEVNLSYILPTQKFEINEEDFQKTVLDYVMYRKNIDVREFKEKVINELMYSMFCEFAPEEKAISDRVSENQKEYKNSNSAVDISSWKPFILGNLLPDIQKPRKRAYTDYDEGNIPFVASGNYNNGVTGYVMPKKNEVLDKGNCITVSAVDGSTFYQRDDFVGRGGGGSSINIIRHSGFNEFSGLFLSAIIGKVCSKYRFADMCSQSSLKREIIYLPVKGGSPDWDFMSEYIKSTSYADMLVK